MSSKTKSVKGTRKKKSRDAADEKSQLDLIPDHGPLPKEPAEPAKKDATKEIEEFKLLPPSPDDPTAEVPLSREEIGAKVCAKRDIIQVASDLLAGYGDPKQAANRLRALQVIVDSLFGKPGAGSDEPPPPADWNGIPAPDRETP
jgi:hypothetical protein